MQDQQDDKIEEHHSLIRSALQSNLCEDFLEPLKKDKSSVIKGISITNREIRYIFPRRPEALLEVQSSTLTTRDLNKLRSQFQRARMIVPKFPYILDHVNSILKCAFCNNQLTFRSVTKNEVNNQFQTREMTLQLKTFSIHHIHRLNQKGEQIWTEDKIQVFSVRSLKSIGPYIKKEMNAMQERRNKFTQIQKLISPVSDFDNLVKQLKLKKCFVKYFPQQFQPNELSMRCMFPDFFIIITPKMKESYLKYGRCVGLDFTFNMFREKHFQLQGETKKQYLTGTITGLNSFRKVSAFAFIISTSENPIIVYNTIKFFIEHMGKEPESIVTDQAPGMIGGMNRLREEGLFSGEYFFDTFHVLKKFKNLNRDLKNMMKEMIKQKCKVKFQRMYVDGVKLARTQYELDALHRFISQSHRSSISQISPTFAGLGISNSQNQFINNMIKDAVPRQTSYITLVNKLINFFEEVNLKLENIEIEKGRIENYTRDLRFELLRFSLCKIVFDFTTKIMAKANKCEIRYKSCENNAQFYYIQGEENIYFVELDLNEFQENGHRKKWWKYSCSCGYQQKSGIFCEHVFKVLLLNEEEFIDHIDPYWLMTEDKAKVRQKISYENVCRRVNYKHIESQKSKMLFKSLFGEKSDQKFLKKSQSLMRGVKMEEKMKIYFSKDQ